MLKPPTMFELLGRHQARLFASVIPSKVFKPPTFEAEEFLSCRLGIVYVPDPYERRDEQKKQEVTPSKPLYEQPLGRTSGFIVIAG